MDEGSDIGGFNIGGFLFGNVDEQGGLDEDFLDESGKKDFGPDVLGGLDGLGLDLNFLNVTKEDVPQDKEAPISRLEPTIKFEPPTSAPTSALQLELSPIKLEPPTSTQLEPPTSTQLEPPTSTQLKSPTSSDLFNIERLKLTKDGRILRYTMFFTGKPAHAHGRYRSRKLCIRKKKGGRQVTFQEDSVEIMRKNLDPQVRGENSKSIFQQIISNTPATGKRLHPSRSRVAYDECRVSVLNTFVKNPAALHKIPDDSQCFHPIELTEWEKNITWDIPEKTATGIATPSLFAGALPNSLSLGGSGSRANSIPMTRPTTPIYTFPSRSSSAAGVSRTVTPSNIAAPKSLAGRIVNLEFARGKWEHQILWEDNELPESPPPTNLQLNLNDPSLILESVDMSSLTEKLIKTEKLIQKRLKRLKFGTTSDGKSIVLAKYDKPVADRFNLSNDKQYEVPLKDSVSTGKNQKSAFNNARMMVSSRIGVQHSVPALKLSMPYYRTFWTKNELRAWHRPKLDLQFVINKPITFEKLAKSKEGRKSSGGIISNSKKISLREKGSDYTFAEYSEEFPLLMMNVGMSTFLLHFYRKQQIKESPTLELTYGAPKILEPNESSPFWIFGDIRPGETLPVIQNNLFRAPLYEHKVHETDFLGLKHNAKGKSVSRWFIRELPAKSLTVGQVFPTMEVFGPHSRKHNVFCRSRIQSFAYRLFRKDSAAGTSNTPRLKISRIMTAFPQFSEGSLRKWLKDYADSVRSGHDSGSWRQRQDAPHLNEDDIRALVTPEMVCQYESMLAGQQRLNDAGFMDLPETEGDEHEAIDNETSEARLAPWNLSSNFINATLSKCTLQLSGLGDPTGRGEGFSFGKMPVKAGGVLKGLESAQQGQALKNARMSNEQVVYRQEIVKIWDAQTRALSTKEIKSEEAAEETIEDIDEYASVNDDATSTSSRHMNKASERKLVIRRLIKDPQTGLEEEQVETITDQRLISAYINQRRVWERKRRRREIAAAASAARAKKARPEGQAPSVQRPRAVSGKPKKIVQVKCGTCGEIGHMRTNRICPRFAEYENESKRSEPPDETFQEPTGRTDSVKISFSKTLLESATSAPVPPIKLKIMPPKKTGNKLEGMSSEQVQVANELSSRLSKVLQTIMSDPESWPFNKPVKKTEYPAYFQIVTNPLDLSTIKSRLKNHVYLSVEKFLDDLKLVRDNCILFNGVDHVFTKTISRLYDSAEQDLAADKQIGEPVGESVGDGGNERIGDGENEQIGGRENERIGGRERVVDTTGEGAVDTDWGERIVDVVTDDTAVGTVGDTAVDIIDDTVTDTINYTTADNDQ